MPQDPADPPFQDILEHSQALLSRLQQLHGEASARLADNQAELLQTRAHAEQLEEEVRDLRQSQQQLAADHQGLIAEHDRLVEAEGQLKAGLAAAEGELRKAQEAREQLRKAYQDLKAMHQAETEKAQRGLKAAFQDLSRLQDELERTRGSLEQARQERTTAIQKLQGNDASRTNELLALEAEAETLREATVGLTGEKGQLEAKVSALQRQVQDASQKVESLETAATAWQGQHQRLIGERSLLLKKVKALEDELAARQASSQAEQEKVRKEVSVLAAEREQRLKERDATAARQAELDQELRRAQARMIAEKEARETQIGTLRQQLEAAQRELQSLRLPAEQAPALQVELQELKGVRQRLEEDRKGLLAQAKALEHDLQAKQASHARERQKLAGELEAARSDVATLQTAQLEWAVDREGLLKERFIAAARQAELERDVQTARTSLAAATDQLEQLEKERHRLEAERTALQGRAGALENDVRSREAAFAKERATSKQQLEEAKVGSLAMHQDYVRLKALQENLTVELNKQTQERNTRDEKLKAELSKQTQEWSAREEKLKAELSKQTQERNAREEKLKAELKELAEAREREKAALKAEFDKDSDAAARFRFIYERGHELYSALNAIIGFSEILLDEQGNRATATERKEFTEHINESGKRLLKSIAELIELARQQAGIIEEHPVELLRSGRSSGLSSPVILVADPDPGVKDRIQILSRAGYELEFAQSAQEALKKAAQLHPIAILIDPNLPPKGGSDLIYELKRNAKTRDIPVVLTSRVSKGELGFDVGECEFLTKPIDRQQLVQMMVKFDLLADGKQARKTPSTVLLVDDDPQNIRLMKAMLKPFNMEILVADGGKSGIEQALKKKPDLVILDLMMPDVDGFEVVSSLRQDPVGSQIPILIYTAKTITSEDRERLKGNIQSIIQKGDFSKERFLEVLNQLPPRGGSHS